MSDAREAVLARIRAALRARPAVDHPGSFRGWRPTGRGAGPGSAHPVEAFEAGFRTAGGEVERFTTLHGAQAWLRALAEGLGSFVCGGTVPDVLRPDVPVAPSDEAALGVSMARAGVAETGTVILDARDGRRSQLLPPTHVIWLQEADLHATLLEFLQRLETPLPSALGLHSGPSKSADIGQILVRGVHGPGRVLVGVLGDGILL